MFKVLQDRLRQRNTETNDRIEKRLKVALNEMAEKDQYDKIIVNNKLTQSSIELNNVILSILTKGVTQ
jgi:guanylate kinase